MVVFAGRVAWLDNYLVLAFRTDAASHFQVSQDVSAPVLEVHGAGFKYFRWNLLDRVQDDVEPVFLSFLDVIQYVAFCLSVLLPVFLWDVPRLRKFVLRGSPDGYNKRD